ncbi:hypothetical protein SFUMM280S_08140 [Streptomyces fumanus]
MTTDTATEVFEAHRPLLLGVAYRMLGRSADAEDVVQEAWLRWSGADRDGVREPRGYLVRVTTRLAVDRLRQIKARGETYVGPWLPEPWVTDLGATAPDAAERAVLADSVSLAVLVVLESLSPLERAVFVLREAFGYPYAEIAAMLERGEAAVRQLAGRARRHVDERRPRYDVDPGRRRDLTERFLAAAAGGDLDALLALLAPGVRLVGDSGGKSKAPLRVLENADKVGRRAPPRPAAAARRRPNAASPGARRPAHVDVLGLGADHPPVQVGQERGDPVRPDLQPQQMPPPPRTDTRRAALAAARWSPRAPPLATRPASISPSTTPSTVGRDRPVTAVISVSVAQSVARRACSTTAELILRGGEGSPPVSRPTVRPPSSCACWPDRTRRAPARRAPVRPAGLSPARRTPTRRPRSPPGCGPGRPTWPVRR